MFYGDGMITPAISVLSAVEGLEVVAPGLKRYVVPMTLAILLALFSIQRHGTARVGGLFGPVMCVWFATLAVLGRARDLRSDPRVLAALSPSYAFAFLDRQPLAAFLALGAVVLAVTGAEALYADMGHFGARRSGVPGCIWSCCRRWCSTISARARCSSPTRRRSRIRSTCWRRHGRCCRWWCSPPARR